MNTLLNTGRTCLGAFILSAVGVSACGGGGVRDLLESEGQPVETAIARFGTPSSDGIMTVGADTLLHEFQNGLYPTVIDTLSPGTEAQVRQLKWDGRPERAVWAVERDGQWIVVNAIEWDANVQF